VRALALLIWKASKQESKKQEARSKKQEARSKKQEARSKKARKQESKKVNKIYPSTYVHLCLRFCGKT
jgi:hypothetical protein